MPRWSWRLSPDAARQRIRELLAIGSLELTRHAHEEMAADDLHLSEVVRVLRAGVVEEPEWERSEWRYRVRTASVIVVVAFEPDCLVVVTTWRVRR
ncbi:MAG: DUF4258 domain-containing protein [Acidobacteriota bacterium]